MVVDLDSIIPAEHKEFERFIFTGRILPEFPSLDMADPLIYKFYANDGTTLYGSISIVNSKIMAIVKTDNQDIFTVRNYVTAQARMVLDVIGFLNGYYLFADIQMAILSMGRQVGFDTRFPALQATVSKRPFEFESLLTMCQDEPLRMALADVRSAMEAAVETGFFCYRAVETLMQSFKVGSDNDATGWKKMHLALHSSRAYIDQTLKSHADVRRHGSVTFITSPERDLCLLTTAAIIDRYTQYLNNGKQPLDIVEFPVITDNYFERAVN